jgi:hypothetical protein
MTRVTGNPVGVSNGGMPMTREELTALRDLTRALDVARELLARFAPEPRQHANPMHARAAERELLAAMSRIRASAREAWRRLSTRACRPSKEGCSAWARKN